MRELKEGDLVIINATGQAGTLIMLGGGTAQVVLKDDYLWTGSSSDISFPQDEAHLEAASKVEVDRFASRKKARR